MSARASFAVGEMGRLGAGVGCAVGEMGSVVVVVAGAGAGVALVVAVAEDGVREVAVRSLRTSESVDCQRTCMTSV